MEDTAVAEYLERIGAKRPAWPDIAALRDLQARHLQAVPFENLSIHLGEPIELAEAALLDKIVRRRRGGFCYELNGLFAALLIQLGFQVTLLAARVIGDGGLGPPYDHLVLRVDLDDGPWLADVGFGRHSRYPLRLDERAPQPDPGGLFQVVDAPDGDVDALQDGVPQYRLELRARTLADFRATCWWHQTSPQSHFTRSLTCSRETPDGRVTLSGRRLIHTGQRGRTERVLADDAAVLAAYLQWFGIRLDRVPTVAAAPPAG